MNWERVNQHYWQSDCGYRIAKCRVRGEFVYVGDHRTGSSNPFASLADASAWCDRHHGSISNAA